MDHRLFFNMFLLWIASFCAIAVEASETAVSSIGTFDRDILENCDRMRDECLSDLFGHIFVKCAATCTKEFQMQFTSVVADNPDYFYELPSSRLFKQSAARTRFHMDDLEGYVTVVAIVPLIPGVAAYYYEMMEHLHTVFSPKVEIVLLPVNVQVEGGVHIRVHDKPNVRVLEEETDVAANAMVQYLLQLKPKDGAAFQKKVDGNPEGEVTQLNMQLDRTTVYVLTGNAAYGERWTSPSLKQLEQRVGMFVKSIDPQEL